MDDLSLPVCPASGCVVYSAVFGGYDSVSPIAEVHAGTIDSFILFTDDVDLSIEGWDIVYVGYKGLSPAELNRAYKLNPGRFFPNAHTTVYVDGNIGVTIAGISLILNFFSDNRLDFLNMSHFARDSIFDEAEILLRSHRVNPFRLLREIYRSYRNIGKSGIKMGENNILVRNELAMEKIGDTWWRMYKIGSGRDQISLPVVLSQVNLSFGCFPMNVREIDGFTYKEHSIFRDENVVIKIARYSVFVLPYKFIRMVFRF
ncbi:glycosyltransferase domain-containing protein [Litorivicinus lipolyticus]|uniref:glycosyltransferase domain-containing protein n=1 Tax=Litorivicinus lipolyticus TaxID=418701 RepID=UPI003B5A8857